MIVDTFVVKNVRWLLVSLASITETTPSSSASASRYVGYIDISYVGTYYIIILCIMIVIVV